MSGLLRCGKCDEEFGATDEVAQLREQLAQAERIFVLMSQDTTYFVQAVGERDSLRQSLDSVSEANSRLRPIVEGLAARDTALPDDYGFHCGLCGGGNMGGELSAVANPANHSTDCAWRQAREWKAAQPAAAELPQSREQAPSQPAQNPTKFAYVTTRPPEWHQPTDPGENIDIEAQQPAQDERR